MTAPRSTYDRYANQGVATGSSAFYIDQKFRDSLAGRKRIFRLNTLNFREFLYFKEQEQLAEKRVARAVL